MNRKSPEKTLAVLLVFLLVFSMPGLTPLAQSEAVAISSADQLIALAYSGEESAFAGSYRLENDIDMRTATDGRRMKAIGSDRGGNQDVPFSGIFDGAGYKITNLELTSAALFDYVSSEGTVKNLTLQSASIHYSVNDSTHYPAALISKNEGTVENCFSVGSTVVSDYCSPAGGLIGTNFGTVSKSGVAGGSVVFLVSGFGTSHGGFVGNQRGGSIDRCFSSALVDARKWAGGFAGKIEDGTISNCYALGTVKGTQESGGFAGALAAPGGLRRVYAANQVQAESGGALIGGKGFSFASLGAVADCFVNADKVAPVIEGVDIPAGVTALSEAEMKTAEFSAQMGGAWDYSPGQNSGYPYLKEARVSPDGQETEQISADLMVVTYDPQQYEFVRNCEPFKVEVPSGTVTVQDLMDQAVQSGQMTYAFGVGSDSTMIKTINGITPEAPAGWMFTINDKASMVGASSALVSEGDKILWYVGAPENMYQAPSWDEMESGSGDLEYIDIAAPGELLALTKDSGNWDKNYRLVSDIDLSGMEFSPVGNEEIPFTGVFDGNGHTVSNLLLQRGKDDKNIGFFGVLSGAMVKNLKLADARVTGGSRVGILVGDAKADLELETANLIANCQVEGVVKGTGTAYVRQTDVGGLVGVNDGGINSRTGNGVYSAIDNCFSAAEVIGDAGTADPAEAGHVGGLVGWNKGTITNSAATGSVTGGNTTGGLVGSNFGGSIYFSHAEGRVMGAYTVGGFVGASGLYSLTENCYATGDVVAVGDYGANFGGFAGAFSGKAKNCVSTGTLSPGWSYNGGFAGTFDGTVWSYNEKLLSLNNCYGNSVTSDGETVKALGNYIGGVHALTDNAAAAIGVSKAAAENKLEEMLKKAGAAVELEAEAAKYKDRVVIPGTVGKEADVTALVAKLSPNALASSLVAVDYEGGGSYLRSGETGYVLTKRAEHDGATDTAVLSLTKDGASVTKNIQVLVAEAKAPVDVSALLENIAKRYGKDASDYWHVLVAQGYSQSKGNTESYISAAERGAYVEQAVEAIDSTDLDTTLAMQIIALRSLGFEPADITKADGTKINALEKLKEAESSGNNGDAYRLIAYQQGAYTTEQETNQVLARLLASQTEDGGWSNNDSTGADPDSTGAVLTSLAPYCQTKAEVKAAVDKAADYLGGLMQSDGNIKSSYKESNYGTNANTSAMVGIALSALGIDAAGDRRFQSGGITLRDGILSFASKDGTGFVYEYGAEQVDDIATKQSALALMAIDRETNIFDFSACSKEAISLKKETGGNGGSGSSGKAEAKTIEVSFTLKVDLPRGQEAHQEYNIWLSEKALSLPENAAASDAIKKALSDGGYTCKGLEEGYITSITTPDNVTLAAGDNGPNSGWLYLVNGQAPETGIKSYPLQNGDKVELYYVDDWTQGNEEPQRYSDVSKQDWFYEAVQFVSENGLFQGFPDGSFQPGQPMTRAMFSVVLGAMAGMEEADAAGKAGFTDVPQDSWYSQAVNWAAEHGIVTGNGDDTFSPEDSITREQLAVMLYRYAKFAGKNVTTADTGNPEFSDWEAVSDWARDAMLWAVNTASLIQGVSKDSLEPHADASRAQVAAIVQRFVENAE